MALNAKINDVMALNVEQRCDFERQMKQNMALNTKLKTSNGYERQTEGVVALDVKMKLWLWIPNEKMINNSERQMENCSRYRNECVKNDFEHQTGDVALNVVTEKWMVALNAKLQGYDERKICPSVACYHNYQSTKMDSMSPKRHSASESEWSNRL